MITVYELYSDESSHKHQSNEYLSIGGIICTEKRREKLHQQLTEVRNTFNLNREMRWGKVSMQFLDAYKSWVNVFLEDPFARFYMLTINRSSHEWNEFQPRTDRNPTNDDRLTSAFYQFLLFTFSPLRDTKRWRIYPDAGFFSRDEVLDRVEFLLNRTYKKAFGPKSTRVIRLSRARNSKSEDLIQLTDVLLGAFSHSIIGIIPRNNARRCIVDYCSIRIMSNPKTKRCLDKVTSTNWTPPEKFNYLR